MAPKESFSQLVGQRPPEAPLRLHTPEAGESYTDPRHYEAVATSARPPRLRIRCHNAPGHSVPYTALLDIVFNEQFPGIFSLVLHYMVVHVTGRNLGPVVDAIDHHRAESIRTYDPQSHDVPGDGLAVIEKVEIEAGR